MGEPLANGWAEYRKLILAELERSAKELTEVRSTLDEIRRSEISEIKTQLALLRFKCSMWGAILGGASGLLVALGAVLLRLVK